MLTALELKVGGLALAVVLALCAFGAWDAHERALGQVTLEAQDARASASAAIDNQLETNRRVVAIAGAASAAQSKALVAQADADAARSADVQLRQRIAVTSRRAAAADPAASDPGACADRAAAVPYDVFAGLDDAAGILGAYADQLSVALNACTASYGALTP